MISKYFTAGFVVKLITGFDDSMTHVPLMSSLTRTKKGKIAFGVGIFLAICVAILFATVFSSVLKLIPNYRYVMAGILVILAIVIYSGKLEKMFAQKTKKNVKKIKKGVSNKMFLKLVFIGFIAAAFTVIDDTLAYSSVFIGATSNWIVIAGILSATLLQIFLIIYFSDKLAKFKFRKEFSGLALVILAVLVAKGIL